MLTAGEREDLVIANQIAAVVNGTVGSLERWIRAWCVVADAYLREGDTAAAVRCLDDGLTLWRWTPEPRVLA